MSRSERSSPGGSGDRMTISSLRVVEFDGVESVVPPAIERFVMTLRASRRKGSVREHLTDTSGGGVNIFAPKGSQGERRVAKSTNKRGGRERSGRADIPGWQK